MNTSSPPPPPDPSTKTAERVRLHITPLTPELLDRFLAPSVRPLASGISFHTVQTFPERRFGFVELPTMEAQKLKKKLNGSTLRGTKVRVDEARPEKKRRSSEDASAGDVDRKARKLERKERRERRREEGVIEGVELEEGRRVKRGWKEERASGRAEEKRRKAKDKPEITSQELQGKKLRFKTSLPPTPNSAGMDVEIKKNKEKIKETKGGKKKVVLEEFGNHGKPSTSSTVAESAAPGALSYEEGRGWVNEAGDLVQSSPKFTSQEDRPAMPQPERRISAIESREIPDQTPDDVPMQQWPGSPPPRSPDTPISQNRDEESAPPAADTPNSVHPLEALFKRPTTRASSAAKPRPKPINTSFTFFSAGGEENEEMPDVDMPPQTPHTKRDLEWRSIRSAAPTPDTAAIGRRFSFPANFAPSEGSAEESDGAREEDMDDERAGAMVEDAGRAGESAWRKSFYENRGDLSRGWRKRRREEKKGLRQRENRRLSRRVV